MNRLAELFHHAASPQYFFTGSRAWVIGLYIVGIAGLLLGSIWGLGFVPPEKYQGDSFRIMFLHVPVAHLSQMIYLAIAVAGVVHIVWRLKMADVFMVSAAPIGCIMTALALASGIIWGIPTWGTGWVWDARTTSVLVLFFLFLGLVALRQAIGRQQRAAFAVSVLAIVGAINIPIIKYSVEWFTTLHQPASNMFTDSAIAPIFLVPLLINLFSMYLFAAGTILASMRKHVLQRNASASWVDDWARGSRI